MTSGDEAARRQVEVVRSSAGASAGSSRVRSGTAVSAGTVIRGRRKATAQQRAHDTEAVERGQLLALLGGASPVVHGHLEDPLSVLYQAGRDLRLDREPCRAQRKAPEEIGPDHLVAG